MSKEAYYFSHDSNARNDIKILKLRRALGLEGYAIFFCIIEMLRDQKDYKMPLSSIQDIAFDLHTSEEKIKTVIQSFDLFSLDENYFFSSRLSTSMIRYNDNKTKLIEAGRKGGLSKAKASIKHRSSIKGNESKEKEMKVNDNSGEKFSPEYVPPFSSVERPGSVPNIEDCKMFFVGLGKTEVAAESFFNHYEGLGWRIANSPISSWRSLAQNWNHAVKINNGSPNAYKKDEMIF